MKIGTLVKVISDNKIGIVISKRIGEEVCKITCWRNSRNCMFPEIEVPIHIYYNVFAFDGCPFYPFNELEVIK